MHAMDSCPARCTMHAKHYIANGLLLGLAWSATANAVDHVVTANVNMTFSPSTLTIAVGDTVTFKNSVGAGTHNARSDPGSVTAFRCANGCDATGGNGNLSNAAWSGTVT